MRFDFNLNSFFPSISIEQILELEFNLAIYAHITNIEHRDFYEVLTLNEMLNNHISRKNEVASGKSGMSNVADMLGGKR